MFCSGLVIRCKSDEFTRFDPPSGQTCAAWANDFVQGFGGYLDNPNDTLACRYCQYAVGDQFFLPLNIHYENRWRDVWVLFAFSGTFSRRWSVRHSADIDAVVFNFIVTVIASRYLRYAKR